MTESPFKMKIVSLPCAFSCLKDETSRYWQWNTLCIHRNSTETCIPCAVINKAQRKTWEGLKPQVCCEKKRRICQVLIGKMVGLWHRYLAKPNPPNKPHNQTQPHLPYCLRLPWFCLKLLYVLCHHLTVHYLTGLNSTIPKRIISARHAMSLVRQWKGTKLPT